MSNQKEQNKDLAEISESVGDLAGGQEQQQHRQELRHAYPGQCHHRSGAFVHVPAHCDGLHLLQSGGHEGCRGKEAEIAQAQHFAGRMTGLAHCRCSGVMDGTGLQRKAAQDTRNSGRRVCSRSPASQPRG